MKLWSQAQEAQRSAKKITSGTSSPSTGGSGVIGGAGVQATGSHVNSPVHAGSVGSPASLPGPMTPSRTLALFRAPLEPAGERDECDVFICNTERDRDDLPLQLFISLTGFGVRCFYNEHALQSAPSASAAEREAAMVRMLFSCKCVVAVLSDGLLKDPNTQRQLRTALARGVRIIAVTTRTDVGDVRSRGDVDTGLAAALADGLMTFPTTHTPKQILEDLLGAVGKLVGPPKGYLASGTPEMAAMLDLYMHLVGAVKAPKGDWVAVSTPSSDKPAAVLASPSMAAMRPPNLLTVIAANLKRHMGREGFRTFVLESGDTGVFEAAMTELPAEVPADDTKVDDSLAAQDDRFSRQWKVSLRLHSKGQKPPYLHPPPGPAGSSLTGGVEEIIVNPAFFKGARVGDIIEIAQTQDEDGGGGGGGGGPLSSSAASQARLDERHERHEGADGTVRLLLQIASLHPLKGTVELSILDTLADTFSLKARREVTVQLVRPEAVALDVVELSFRDQFISRADLWRFKEQMCNQVFHLESPVTVYGMRAQVDRLLIGGQCVTSGLVSSSTKFSFRSRHGG
jgi:hypothetical protein